MTWQAIWASFSSDKTFNSIGLLIAADLLLGVIAALRTNTFKVQWLLNFGRDDVLFKVLPWFILYTIGKLNTGTIVAGWVTWSDVATTFYAGAVAVLIASLVKSLGDLGVPIIPPQLISLAGSNPFKPGAAYLAADGDDRAAYVPPAKAA